MSACGPPGSHEAVNLGSKQRTARRNFTPSDTNSTYVSSCADGLCYNVVRRVILQRFGGSVVDQSMTVLPRVAGRDQLIYTLPRTAQRPHRLLFPPRPSNPSTTCGAI